jgi:aminopeptidase YwaD
MHRREAAEPLYLYSMKRLLTLFIYCLTITLTHAQPQKPWLMHEIKTLAGSSFAGRGYVNRGSEKASLYLQRRFKEMGLQSFNLDSSMLQPYTFSVQTFPGDISLKLGKKELKPGADYIIHENSSAFRSDKKLRLQTLDVTNIRDTLVWDSLMQTLKPNRAYFLKGWDSAKVNLKWTRRIMQSHFPKRLFIIPQHGKITWSVGRDAMAATIFYVEDTVLPKRMRKVKARLDAKFFPDYKCNNVIGYVPGTERPDSFIVFSAHFDHLGKMGRRTTFPGAHDNASGTSLMLGMADYYSKHPQRYSMVFMGFSGEEAGLLGSKYYVDHPLFPLSDIKMVFNVDMTGVAKDGITVVNAQEQAELFKIMSAVNDSLHFLPKMNQREQTQNSDHYSFSKKGAPAIFIFGLGGMPYYHDVFDVPKALTLENIDNLALLLIDVVGRLQ